MTFARLRRGSGGGGQHAPVADHGLARDADDAVGREKVEPRPEHGAVRRVGAQGREGAEALPQRLHDLRARRAFLAEREGGALAAAVPCHVGLAGGAVRAPDGFREQRGDVGTAASLHLLKERPIGRKGIALVRPGQRDVVKIRAAEENRFADTSSTGAGTALSYLASRPRGRQEWRFRLADDMHSSCARMTVTLRNTEIAG